MAAALQPAPSGQLKTPNVVGPNSAKDIKQVKRVGPSIQPVFNWMFFLQNIIETNITCCVYSPSFDVKGHRRNNFASARTRRAIGIRGTILAWRACSFSVVWEVGGWLQWLKQQKVRIKLATSNHIKYGWHWLIWVLLGSQVCLQTCSLEKVNQRFGLILSRNRLCIAFVGQSANL